MIYEINYTPYINIYSVWKETKKNRNLICFRDFFFCRLILELNFFFCAVKTTQETKKNPKNQYRLMDGFYFIVRCVFVCLLSIQYNLIKCFDRCCFRCCWFHFLDPIIQKNPMKKNIYHHHHQVKGDHFVSCHQSNSHTHRQWNSIM